MQQQQRNGVKSSVGVEPPPVSIFVPPSSNNPGGRSDAILVPPHCCTFGLAGLLRRLVNEHFMDPSRSQTPLIEAPDGVSAHALRLCVEYLDHFSPKTIDEALGDDDGDVIPRSSSPAPTATSDPSRRQPRRGPGPSVLPTPLTGPLDQLLTPWENTFIATRLLGNNGDAWDHGDLLAVLHAAQFLEIEALEALCSAWCGSQITKMCNSTKNCFEAAEMIRKFFNITKDWTPEEEECLRIENEWPEGEE